MNPPTQEQVVAYAAQHGWTALLAANFHSHCTEGNWHFKDGKAITNWKACLRLWVEATQNRAGHEIVLHDKPHENQKRFLYKQRQSDEFKRDDIIRQGRKAKATDELIGEVLAKNGVSW